LTDENAPTAEARASGERAPLWRRTLGVLPFVSSGDEDGEVAQTVETLDEELAESGFIAVQPKSKGLRDLLFSLKVSPADISLRDDKRLNLRMILANTGKELVALRFRTSQELEILVRDDSGAVVTRWSEDYVFEPSYSTLIVNPGERIEYEATVSTRDMKPGQTYTLDVAVVGYSALRVSKVLTPSR
jgi:hypothetical protein